MKVFISSTWEDLQAEREAVEKVIHRMSQQFVGMEYFGSRPETPRQASLSEVEGSDIYIGIFGFRYGSIDREKGGSITELEYRKATEKRLPCLIYFKDERAKVSLTDVETRPRARAKLDRLKNELADHHTITRFENPHDLAAKVGADLARWMTSVIPARDLAPRSIVYTLADFPRQIEGDWVILCGGKREEVPVGRERDLLVVDGDPRELTWILKLGLPPTTIIIDDKCPDYVEFVLKEEKRNLIAVGSPGVNFFVREHYLDAFFRYYYEITELQRYKRLEQTEVEDIRMNLGADFLKAFDEFVRSKKEVWDQVKRFWKSTHYVLPLERHPNEAGAVEYRGLISLALHPYHDDRMALFAGGSRFVSTVAAVRMLAEPADLRVRELGGIVGVQLLDRRRGFDVHRASYGWQTRPYTIQQMITGYQQMIAERRCDSLGYTDDEARGFIGCLSGLIATRGKKSK
jgi:hypothetical protein